MLTANSYNELLATIDAGKSWLASEAWRLGIQEQYGTIPSSRTAWTKLYFYLAVLETWDNHPGAINYLTEAEIKRLTGQAEAIYKLCTSCDL